MKKSPMFGGVLMLTILVALLMIPMVIGHMAIAQADVPAESLHADAAQ